jgi:hypothetical protein
MYLSLKSAPHIVPDSNNWMKFDFFFFVSLLLGILLI